MFVCVCVHVLFVCVLCVCVFDFVPVMREYVFDGMRVCVLVCAFDVIV